MTTMHAAASGPADGAIALRAAEGSRLLLALCTAVDTVCGWTTSAGRVFGVRRYRNAAFESPLELLALYVAGSGIRPRAACIAAPAGFVRCAGADSPPWTLDAAEARDWLGLSWLAVIDAADAAPSAAGVDALDGIAAAARASAAARPSLSPLRGTTR